MSTERGRLSFGGGGGYGHGIGGRHKLNRQSNTKTFETKEVTPYGESVPNQNPVHHGG